MTNNLFYLLISFSILSCTHFQPIHGDHQSSQINHRDNSMAKSKPQRINRIVSAPINSTHNTYEVHNSIQKPIVQNTEPSVQSIHAYQTPQAIQPYEKQLQRPEELTVNIDDEFEEQDDYTNIATTEPLNKKIYENLDIANEQLSGSQAQKIQSSSVENYIDEEQASRSITAQFIEQTPELSQFDNPGSTNQIINSKTESEIVNEDYETMTYNANFITNFDEERKNKWVQYFSVKDKDRFERFISNGSAYKNFIMETLEKQGVPKEIFYVGLIESGYYLKAKSHAKAVGPWQFIKGVGKEYGLRVNSYVDERRDIEKSTKAAAVLFNDLYNIFGSWELALSAYNAGPYRMIGLIRRHNTRDYTELTTKSNFPKETADYVPKVAAVMEILNKPELYDIQIRPKQDYKSNTTLIPLKYSQSLESISKKLKLSVSELKNVNPELLGNHTPYRKKSKYMLRVPIETYYNHGNQIASLENYKGTNPFRKSYAKKSPSKKTQFHKVKKGQTLSQIAMQYKTSSSKLIKLNKFKNSRIFVGQNLKVPHSKVRKKITHKVKRGENLSLIAKKFKTSVERLMEKNSIKKGKIYPGQRLIIR